MTKTLADISEAMKDIDFCMLVSRAANGALSGRPMSNNREVAYEGTNWFFSTDDSQHIKDITGDSNVALTYQGKAGLKGWSAPRACSSTSKARHGWCATRPASPSTGTRISTAGSNRASIRQAL